MKSTNQMSDSISEIKDQMKMILNLKNDSDDKKSKLNELQIMMSQQSSDLKKDLLFTNEHIYSLHQQLESVMIQNVDLEKKLQIYKNSDKGSIGMFEGSIELYHQKLILNLLLVLLMFTYIYFLYENNMITFSTKLKEKAKGITGEIQKQYNKGNSIIERAKPNFFRS